MTRLFALTVSLPTVLDLKHAAIAYAVIVGVAVLLWIVSAAVGTLLEWRTKRQDRAYVIARMFYGDRR